MQNKKIVKILKRTANVLLAVALVLPVLMLAGCARKLESEGMRIIDKKTGSAYSFMPAYLEPAARSKKVYAKATLSGAERSLYTISGLEPSEWLCTEWGDILYSGTDIIASLYTFDPVRAYICDTEGTVSIALVAITGDDVALMRAHCAPSVKVKAAGGISSIEDAERFIELGAERLGTSRIVKIAKQLEAEKGE